MRMITKVTQVLELLKLSGYQISAGNLEQLFHYNKTEINQKTAAILEPGKLFTEKSS